jgi:hypothetical protein
MLSRTSTTHKYYNKHKYKVFTCPVPCTDGWQSSGSWTWLCHLLRTWTRHHQDVVATLWLCNGDLCPLICCHLFSADNISVFMSNFIHVQFHVIYIKSYLFPHKFPLKIWKLLKELLNFKMETIQLPLPNRVVNIG